MQTVIKGKNIELSESLRQYVERKTSKLSRYLDNIIGVEVELSSEKTRSSKTRQVAQVTVNVNGTLLRAEVRADDMFAAVDTVTDKIRRQVKSYKDRLYFRAKAEAGRAQPAGRPVLPGEGEPEDEGRLEDTAEIAGRIVRAKRFTLKPMSPEEALDQMELLAHDFFIFTDAATERVNVVYRRRDGSYGLLIPETA